MSNPTIHKEFAYEATPRLSLDVKYITNMRRACASQNRLSPRMGLTGSVGSVFLSLLR
jgi:hypothetical protein